MAKGRPAPAGPGDPYTDRRHARASAESLGAAAARGDWYEVTFLLGCWVQTALSRELVRPDGSPDPVVRLREVADAAGAAAGAAVSLAMAASRPLRAKVRSRRPAPKGPPPGVAKGRGG